MATQKGMSGVDVRAFLSELKTRLPLWIGKIYQYDPNSFGFRLNGENKQKSFLYCVSGVRAHFVTELPPAPKNPSGFSMYLRKYIEGGKILSIEQKGIERVLIITIGKGPQEFHLIIELFDEGNLILTNTEFNIINALTQKRFRERDIIAGAVYDGFAKSPENLTYEEFKEKLIDSDSDIVRTMATKLLLGGIPSEEICAASGISKNMPMKFAEDTQIRPVYDAMKTWIENLKSPHPVIDAKGAFPFISQIRKPQKEFSSFSEALEAYYPKYISKTEETSKKQLTKEERIRFQQESAIRSFEKKADEATKISDIIYGHYGEVKEVIDVLSDASKRMSWQDIETILKKSENPCAKRIISLNPENASVILDLGEPQKVTIYLHDSLEANAGRYAEQAKKFRAKKTGALRAMEAGTKRKEKKDSMHISRLKPKWYHRFRWMETSDGVLVIGGRNADQNEELIKKYMEGKDRFMHADVFGASTVIVKGTTTHIDEAAKFAASYSRLWSSGVASGNVIEASPSQVSKTAESGEYVAHGSFVIRGERIIHKDVPLEIAIGLMTEPVLAVIGGVPSVIDAKTKVSVHLKPGTYEGNDIAKKVLRKLKEGIPENESKNVKAILNTEAVAAFVPPGGSDIV